jgi:mannose-6-phosphate isomerase
MSAYPLQIRRIDKPWGRHKLWPGFVDSPSDQSPVGEAIFGDEASGELLVKYLFTSEKLSIQVHPNDAQAQAAGHVRGKDEAWVILAAEPDSTVALGFKQPLTAEALRAAALDGTIEQLVDWKPVKPGDVIYSPAGTVHAIGAGITLVEIQQNVDLTYRLYDYGRPRELHLNDGVAVSSLTSFTIENRFRALDPDRVILSEGAKFVLERWTWNGPRTLTLPDDIPAWFVPLSGRGTLDESEWATGQCWHMNGGSHQIELETGSECLFAYPLPAPLDLFS